MNTRCINRFIFSILSLLMSGLCSAQDTIVKKDGQLIIGKVLEVSSMEVKYKKEDFPDGPTYTQIKSTIERINYHGGYVDIFKEEEKVDKEKLSKNDEYVQLLSEFPIIKMGALYRHGPDLITEREMQQLLLNTKDPEIMFCVKNARASKGWRYIGFAAIPLIICSFTTLTVGSEIYNQSNSEAMLTWVFLLV